MGSEYQHKILVIDNDKQVGKAIEGILKAETFEFIFFNNGESAIEEIKNTKKPFSLIIADQGLRGMTGTQLLEHAIKLTPESTRVLMTAHSEVKTIINAVNIGEIQRYIVKPWKDEDLTLTIKSGIKLYELFLDNKKLLNLAKNQNTKLYDLNCELMEATTTHNKTIQELDNDIEKIEKEINDLSFKAPINPAMLKDEITNHIKNDNGVDLQKVQTLFSNTIKDLYEQFKELAYRNAFEMPDIKGKIQ